MTALGGKFENNFTAAFSLRGMSHCGLYSLSGYAFSTFVLSKTALRHLEKRPKRFHSLLHRRVIVPFVDPNSAKAQVFENEQTIWDFQRLQAHRTNVTSVDSGARVFARRSALPPPTAFNPKRIGALPVEFFTSSRRFSPVGNTTSPLRLVIHRSILRGERHFTVL